MAKNQTKQQQLQKIVQIDQLIEVSLSVLSFFPINFSYIKFVQASR